MVDNVLVLNLYFKLFENFSLFSCLFLDKIINNFSSNWQINTKNVNDC